jgi:hypothetical protein
MFKSNLRQVKRPETLSRSFDSTFQGCPAISRDCYIRLPMRLPSGGSVAWSSPWRRCFFALGRGGPPLAPNSGTAGLTQRLALPRGPFSKTQHQRLRRRFFFFFATRLEKGPPSAPSCWLSQRHQTHSLTNLLNAPSHRNKHRARISLPQQHAAHGPACRARPDALQLSPCRPPPAAA